jgi:nucleoside-diphosphate-sugar epimerase
MMTAPAARTKLLPLDSVEVVDNAEVGNLYYGDRNEDGERPVLRPDREAIVSLVTDYGEVYHLACQFGDDFEKAERAAARIRAEGSVNLNRWRFVRVVYGSSAYVGEEPYLVAREREDALWD